MQACAVARCAGLLVSVGAEASDWGPRRRARPKEPRSSTCRRGHRHPARAPQPGLNQVLNPQPARVTHQTPYRPSIALRPFDVSDLDIARGAESARRRSVGGRPLCASVSGRARPRPPTARPATATGTHRPALWSV